MGALVRAGQVPDPPIEHPGDVIVRITRSCICGSDSHLYHGLVPDTRVGSIFGHAFTGVFEEVGADLDPADRPAVPMEHHPPRRACIGICRPSS